MTGAERYLSAEQAAAVYDRIGRLQDTQAFYERAAVDALIRAGEFGAAGNVLEVGCGTGALAARLLADHLPEQAGYVAVDVSPKMISLAGSRLRGWSDRARVARIDGDAPWPVSDAAADRVVATYVLDLLAPAAIVAFFAEAARVLRPGGLVAIASLAAGRRGVPRLVSAGWSRLWSINPRLTGGCRPVDPVALLPADWDVRMTMTVTSWAITSAVLIAERPAR